MVYRETHVRLRRLFDVSGRYCPTYHRIHLLSPRPVDIRQHECVGRERQILRGSHTTVVLGAQHIQHWSIGIHRYELVGPP